MVAKMVLDRGVWPPLRVFKKLKVAMADARGNLTALRVQHAKLDVRLTDFMLGVAAA